MSDTTHITAAYAFLTIPEEDLPVLREELLAFGRDRAMKGLVLIATEGINSTVSGSAAAINEWKEHLRSIKSDIVFKDSMAAGIVFKRWSVKIKREIVSLQQEGIHPDGPHRHLSPAEWNRVLQQEDVVIVDARNSYEYQIGAFKNAIDCGTRTFSEFPDFVASSQIPKEKKVLMYCTGGIRCEKALLEMEKQGYHDVYQLEGGILAYLQQFPDASFEGECFVFDKRVAVDQKLQPSQTYAICPHCGLPGTFALQCAQCKGDAVICHTCAEQEHRRTCSKHCAYVTSKKMQTSSVSRF